MSNFKIPFSPLSFLSFYHCKPKIMTEVPLKVRKKNKKKKNQQQTPRTILHYNFSSKFYTYLLNYYYFTHSRFKIIKKLHSLLSLFSLFLFFQASFLLSLKFCDTPAIHRTFKSTTLRFIKYRDNVLNLLIFSAVPNYINTYICRGLSS